MNDLLKRFKTYKIDIEGRSSETIEQYLCRANKFFEFAKINTIEQFLEIRCEDVKNWLSYLAEKNSPRTRNIMLTAVKEIYKYAYEQEDMKIDNKIAFIKFAKVAHKESNFLDETSLEVSQFLYYMKNVRTRAMVITFLNTGIRFSEMASLKIDDIEKNPCYIIGKGNKERPIFFSDDVLRAINRYIVEKRNVIIEQTNSKTDILFISNEGNPIDKSSFTKSLKHVAKRAKISWWQQMSPHKLRHTFATQKLNERDEKGNLKNTIKDVSVALGHSNTNTTSGYVHSNIAATERIMKGE